MAVNPYVNKVVYNDSTLIDLTEDTVTPETLIEGYTAHDRSGAPIVGTAVMPYTVSTYPYENTSYAAVYKYGRICFITCVGGNWYTTAAGQNLRQGSATNLAWSVPANCAPINDVEIHDVNTGKRIKVLTTRDVIAATQLNGEALRFSGCWVTAE